MVWSANEVSLGSGWSRSGAQPVIRRISRRNRGGIEARWKSAKRNEILQLSWSRIGDDLRSSLEGQFGRTVFGIGVGGVTICLFLLIFSDRNS